MLYARGSKVFGQFANPYEYAGGVKWYFLPTERVWLTAELMRVQQIALQRSLYSVYRGYDWLGADDSDGSRFLTL